MARTEKITVTCTRTGFSKTGTPDEIAEFFYRDKSTATGFSPWCKDAEREYNQAYRAGLSKANATRKADADAKGVKVFDATMKSMGVRTSRGASKSSTTRKARATSTPKDGTRTRRAKTTTRARASARKAKATRAA